MNPATSAMLKRMMATDPEWAPTLMRRTDIDTTVDEPDPKPVAAGPPIEVKRSEPIVFEIRDLVVCSICKLKTYDDQADRCRYPDCGPR